MADVTITIQIEEKLLHDFEKVCADAGCTVEDAIVAFFEKTVELGRLPFDITEGMEG